MKFALKYNRKIARSLMISVVLASTAITVLTTAYQLYGNYRRDVGELQNRILEIENIHLRNLATRLWVADMLELNRTLDSILYLPEIQYLEIFEDNHRIASVGDASGDNLIIESYPLIYEHRQQKLQIGVLNIHFTLSGIYRRLVEQVFDILISNAFKTFLITGFILYIFHSLVTRHLQKIAGFAEQIDIDNLEKRLALNRKKSASDEADELDTLVVALSRMQDNLRTSIEELKESELHYRSLVESSSAIPWRMDPLCLRYNYIGPQIVAVLGYPAEKWYGNNFWQQTVLPEDAEIVTELYNSSRSECQNRQAEYRARAKNGEIVWIRDDVRVVCVDGRTSKMEGFIFDITQRKETELELAKYHQHLQELVDERTAKLRTLNEELESFSYSVSHDLRAPLRAINGFGQALCEDYGENLDETAKFYLKRINKGTVRMSRLIDDLLKLARLTRSEVSIEDVQIEELVEKVFEELQSNNPDRVVEIVIKCHEVVRADYRLLKVLLENLLGNAWKYTSKSSKAIIEFGMTVQQGEKVYYIKDNGVGFDMKYADKLFQVFHRLHGVDEFDGTGIGLATAQRVINRHGGRIWADSRVNKGSTFYFTLGRHVLKEVG